MDLPALRQDRFSGALIHAAQIGPRRELALTVEPWPTENGQRKQKWRKGEGPLVRVRFGGIVNFDEVSAFFGDFAHSRNANEQLHYLDYAVSQASKPGHLYVQMELDRTEHRLTIECSNVATTAATTE